MKINRLRPKDRYLPKTHGVLGWEFYKGNWTERFWFWKLSRRIPAFVLSL